MRKLLTALAFLLTGSLALGLTGCGSGSSDGTTTASAAANDNSAVEEMAVISGNQQVTLSWTDDSDNADDSTYNIYFATTPGVKKTGAGVTKLANVTTPYAHSGLVNGTTYYYVVTKVAPNGVEGAESYEVSATPQAGVPAAPSGLIITAMDGAVKFAFDVTAPIPSGTLRYNVYWSKSSNVSTTSGTKIPNVAITPATPANTFTHQSLVNGDNYYYVVTVEVGGVESKASKTLMAIPKAAVAPIEVSGVTTGKFGSPTDLTVDAGNMQATISWTAALSPLDIGDDKYTATPVYTVYSATDQGFTQNLTSTSNITTTSFKLTGLDNGTTYFFKVSSYVQETGKTAVINEVDSAIISAVPEAKTPAAPAGLSAAQGNQQVSLSWTKDKSGIPTAVTASVIYNIYFSTEKPASGAALVGTGTKIGNITTSSYVHSGLTTGKTYYYVVTAVGEGESEPSSIVSVTL